MLFRSGDAALTPPPAQMSVWTLSWALRLFLVGEIVLLLNVLVAASIYGTLLVYRPSASASVLDYIFIQVPAR